jgi:hypothetical protein
MRKHRIQVVALALAVLATADAYGVTVRMYLDVSGSLDPDAVTSLQSEGLSQAIVSIPNLERVELYPFATMRQALSGRPAVTLKVAIQDAMQVNCGEMDRGTQRVKAARAEFERKCEALRAEARRRQEQERKTAAESLRKVIEQHLVQRKQLQTCVDQVVSRALADPPNVLNVIVTDLRQEGCPSPPGPIRPLFSEQLGGARTLVLLVPSRSDADPVAAIQKRMDSLKRRAPSVRVVPYTQLQKLPAELSH